MACPARALFLIAGQYKEYALWQEVSTTAGSGCFPLTRIGKKRMQLFSSLQANTMNMFFNQKSSWPSARSECFGLTRLGGFWGRSIQNNLERKKNEHTFFGKLFYCRPILAILSSTRSLHDTRKWVFRNLTEIPKDMVTLWLTRSRVRRRKKGQNNRLYFYMIICQLSFIAFWGFR